MVDGPAIRNENRGGSRESIRRKNYFRRNCNPSGELQESLEPSGPEIKRKRSEKKFPGVRAPESLEKVSKVRKVWKVSNMSVRDFFSRLFGAPGDFFQTFFGSRAREAPVARRKVRNPGVCSNFTPVLSMPSSVPAPDRPFPTSAQIQYDVIVVVITTLRETLRASFCIKWAARIRHAMGEKSWPDPHPSCDAHTTRFHGRGHHLGSP